MVLDRTVVETKLLGQLIQIVGPVVEKHDYLYTVLSPFLPKKKIGELLLDSGHQYQPRIILYTIKGFTGPEGVDLYIMCISITPYQCTRCNFFTHIL